MTRSRSTHLAAAGALSMLILLCLAWELWLAPLRPGGSWLALKVLPLLWITPGIVRGRLYTFRASTMLILAYFAEGTVRAYTDQGVSGLLAFAEIALTSLFFVLAIAHVRASRAVRS
ncbi:MAG: DUF2069 domain-containing protein [Burkholderiales bacterium]